MAVDLPLQPIAAGIGALALFPQHVGQLGRPALREDDAALRPVRRPFAHDTARLRRRADGAPFAVEDLERIAHRRARLRISATGRPATMPASTSRSDNANRRTRSTPTRGVS